jgi:hypothetical protein
LRKDGKRFQKKAKLLQFPARRLIGRRVLPVTWRALERTRQGSCETPEITLF